MRRKKGIHMSRSLRIGSGIRDQTVSHLKCALKKTKQALAKTMQRQGWKVEQVSFIAGARSLNEEELKKNLAYFKVPSASVEPIRTKLAMTIFDEYASILKGMYSIRFNGRSDHGGTTARPSNGRSDHGDTAARPAWGPSPPTPWGPLKSLSRLPSVGGVY